MASDGIRKQLRLPKIGQIGYVVADVDDAIAHYKNTFGVRPWLLLRVSPEPCMQDGQEIHPTLRIALAYLGPVQLELIQVAEGESLHLDYLKQTGGGLHHLGFMTRNLDNRLNRCRDMGIGVLQRGTIKDTGVTVDYAYLDTAKEAGIILEFIQWRVGPVPLAVNRYTFRTACSLGPKSLLKGRVVR